MKALKIFAFAAVAAVMAVSCGRSEVKVDVELPTNAEIDSVSYLVGFQLGSFLKGQLAVEDPSEIDLAMVKKGMVDVLKAEDPKGYNDTTFAKQFKVSPYEMQRILGTYIQKKMEYKAEVNSFNMQDPWALNVEETISELNAQRELFMSYIDYIQ